MRILSRALIALPLCVAAFALPARADLAAVPTRARFADRKARPARWRSAGVGSVEVNGVVVRPQVRLERAYDLSKRHLMGSARVRDLSLWAGLYRDEMARIGSSFSGSQADESVERRSDPRRADAFVRRRSGRRRDSVPIGNSPGVLRRQARAGLTVFRTRRPLLSERDAPGETVQ